MSDIQKRKVAKLAAAFMMTTIGTLGCSGSAYNAPAKDPCHTHVKDNKVQTFDGKHCHKNNGSKHEHVAKPIVNPIRRPPPKMSVNPAPPRPPKPPKL